MPQANPPAAATQDARVDNALLTRITAQARRHNVTQQGRTIAWYQFGEGPPLVLVHGGHGDWRHWLRNIDALASGRSLWLMDMPGFGASDDLGGDPNEPDRMQRLVAALHASLDSLVGAQTAVDLAGFSFGGLVAARLAGVRPVRKLALLGPAGHASMRRQMVQLVDWRKAPPEGRRDALQQNLASFMLSGAAAVDELAINLYAAQCEATRFRSKAISRSGGLAEALDHYGGPALLVWGEHDVTCTPPEAGPRLCAGHSQHAWRVVPGAGHWVQYEKPEMVSALLVEWLSP